MQYLSIALIGAVAIFFWWLSTKRVKKIQKYTDPYAVAFCEAADHLIGSGPFMAGLCYDTTDGGGIRVRPVEEQPEAIQEMIHRGVDDYAVTRIHTMYQMREEAQQLLTSNNLIGDRFNMVLNHTYNLTNLVYTVLSDITMIKNPSDLNDFNTYLQKQGYLRNVTLASVISEDCKKNIART